MKPYFNQLHIIAGALTAVLTLSFQLSSASESVFPEAVEISRTGKTPRNVIFILTDDHRYDAMGFLGHPFMETPNLDSMAARGAYLKNAFVTTSLCSPSRASILTGLYTHKHGVIDNQRLEPEDILYFPQYLQKAGYQTAYIGKWHMGSESDDPRPGFDHWVSFEGQGHYLPPTPNYTLNVNGNRVKQQGYITDELTDYAMDWLENVKSKDQPFFLYLSHKAVHANFTPAERHEDRYSDEPWDRPSTENMSEEQLRRLPRWLRDQRNSWHGVDFPYHSSLDIERYYKRYCEAFLAVDDSRGRVLEFLKREGLEEETLVIYMGDNGFMFGEHGLIDKRVAYETSIRVPMVMQCPALFGGGTVVDEVVANIDIGPTILEAAGLETPDYMDGQSFIQLAQGQNLEGEWRDYFLYVYYWEKNFPQSPTVFALRGEQYKYITYYGLWDTDELYDLVNDPEESQNLIGLPEYASVQKEMAQQLYAMLSEAGGMNIPMNEPRAHQRNKRLSERGGWKSADFPEQMVVDEPINFDAN